MKSKSFVLVFVFTFLMCMNVHADGIYPSVFGDGVYGEGEDTLEVNVEFSLIVDVESSDSASRSFWSTPFKFYGTGNVNSLAYQSYVVESLFYFIDDWIGAPYLESWDGDLTVPDKFGYYGEPGNIGWDAWGYIRAFTFNFVIEGDNLTEGQFCIDSGNFIESQLDWLFAPPEIPWSGPYCWPVKMAPPNILCGDFNEDGNVNLLDIMYMIFCLYMIPDPPCDFTYWDIDGSGDVNILDMVYLINYLYNNGPEPECLNVPVGELFSVTGCGVTLGIELVDPPPYDQDCVEYIYYGDGTLELNHLNAGFNCCPGEISAIINIFGNEIHIIEMESDGMCDCACLYELNYEIYNIPEGVYTIKFVEPYRHPDDPVLECTIDISENSSETCCVPRYHYPWWGK